MDENHKALPRSREGIFAAISVGFFLVLAGTIFTTTPNLYDSIVAFFRNFDILRVPNAQFSLPAPTTPDAHLTVYAAAWQFSAVWGLFQIALLSLRLFVRSPLAKKAENFSDVIFWFGTSYMVYTLLNEMTTITIWFVFWSGILTLLGFSLVIRAIILAAYRSKR